MTSTIVLGIALHALGPLLLACAALVWWRDRRRRARMVRTTGEVIGWSHQGQSPFTDQPSRPVVRFQTGDGHTVTASPPSWSDVGWYPTGPAPVWYPADDPEAFVTHVTWGDRHDLVLAALGVAACGLWFLA